MKHPNVQELEIPTCPECFSDNTEYITVGKCFDCENVWVNEDNFDFYAELEELKTKYFEE